jgi:hypothetical protein
VSGTRLVHEESWTGRLDVVAMDEKGAGVNILPADGNPRTLIGRIPMAAKRALMEYERGIGRQVQVYIRVTEDVP